MGFFDLTKEEERSFLVVVRHTVLEGPLKLVRFSDSGRERSGKSGRYGRYWMYGSEVKEAMAANQGKRLIREISKRWAVSDDWGDLELTWLMDIPRGRSLNAYWGFAKFQPKISVKGQNDLGKATKRSYEGGSIQLVVSLDEEQKCWIQGPYRTVGLSTSNIHI
jgi:hypothetical protein